MAVNTIDTYLMQGTGSGTLSYSKIVDIKDYPDIIGEKELLEVTTLSDKSRKYIQGLQNGDRLDFTCNYVYTDYNTVKALDDGTLKHIRIAFGYNATGSKYGTDGYFDFDAYVSVRPLGKGVNEVREMQVSLIVSSDITVGQAS